MPSQQAQDPSVQDLIRQEATKAGVPPELALAVGEQESSFNPTLTGPKLPSGESAVGTFQLLPSTAQRLGVDPHNPVQNIQGGVRYLRDLLDRHQGNLPKVLAEYGGVKADQTYVPGVLGRLGKFRTADTAVGQPPPMRMMASHAVGQPPPSASEKGWLRSTLESFDPRTPEGRRNLAGGAGAAVGVALAPETGGLSLLAPIAGAAIGGAGAEAGEQLVGTKPPSGEAIVGAGAEQGFYETLGQGAMRGIINPIGRRLIGTRVGKFAAGRLQGARETLSASKASILTHLRDGLDAAQQLVGRTQARVRQGVSAAAEVAHEGVQAARGVTAKNVGVAEERAAQGVSGAEASQQAAETVARQPYEALVGQPPPAASAGRATTHVVYGETGGAKRARDLAGQAVEQAAESGPPVSKAPLMNELDRLSEQITPSAQGMGTVSVGGREFSAEQAARMFPQEDLAALLPPEHPLPGVLNRVRGFLAEGGDTLSFSDAHKIKRMVDDAVNWQSPAKKQAQQITKGFRQTLRDTMSGHAPYDRATAAYAKIAPLYTQGIALRLRKLATEEPEAVVRLINPKQPTRAAMLVDVLTHQAEAGGGGAEGRQALYSVQAAWLHEKIIKGGVEKLGERIDALPPAFRSAFLGDPHASAILDNLKMIASAYKAAASTEGVEAATVTGKAGVEAAKELGAQRVEAARTMGRHSVQGMRDLGAEQIARARADVPAARSALETAKTNLSATERGLREQQSTLGRSTLTPRGTEGADALRALVLLPHGSIWGAMSMARLMHGPTARDLITWASASPAGTRALVTALTSPAPALALADLARSSGILQEDEETPLTPPPAPSTPQRVQVGQPPPR